MDTSRFQLHFILSNFNNPIINPARITPKQAKSSLEIPQHSPSLKKAKIRHNSRHGDRNLKQELVFLKSKILPRNNFSAVASKGHSRIIFLGAVSLGLAVLLMGFEDRKAFAVGPGGPLVEEFWDNMRRYGLYVLTVSTGAIYTLLQPIVELLKNPITALFILAVLGGGFFIVSQVVSAMIGITDFSYEYSFNGDIERALFLGFCLIFRLISYYSLEPLPFTKGGSSKHKFLQFSRH